MMSRIDRGSVEPASRPWPWAAKTGATFGGFDNPCVWHWVEVDARGDWRIRARSFGDEPCFRCEGSDPGDRHDVTPSGDSCASEVR